MDNRPIGIFDSGLGGLTAVREMEHLLPHEDLIYFGDTGRVPYGTKGNDTIVRYARQIARFLRGADVKTVLIACNTVSTVAYDEVCEEAAVPVFGVVEPTVSTTIKQSCTGEILVIGTSATVRSRAYEKAIHALYPEAHVQSKACPLFVPLVENDHFGEADPVALLVAHEYLDEYVGKVDTVILGCTHYPILSSAISAVFGQTVTLINSGKEMDSLAAKKLAEAKLLSARKEAGKEKFYVSDYTDNCTQLAETLLEHSLAGHVEKTNIEEY